jgi:AcrR family transcriptional regulator
MARPKSDDKRLAILDASIKLFADRGPACTPTAAISVAARVAEGTLFTYFATKEDLVNEVYRMLKREVAVSLAAAYPTAADARLRFRHVWDRYIEWGVSHPEKFRVLEQLEASDSITEESRQLGMTALKEIERVAKDGIRKKRIRNTSLPYLAAVMTTLAETTISFIAGNQHSRVDYSSAGFEIFWAGIALH